MASRLLDRKVRHVLAAGADAVVTANPGCILQIAQGLRERGSRVNVLHLVEVLDRAYGSARRSQGRAERSVDGSARRSQGRAERSVDGS
jgi:glycolate oxidase iron-sulfur subunit